MTKRLFIIGNGFDIAHGLSTRYDDFKSYLETYYLCKQDYNFFVQETLEDKKGFVHYDEEKCAKLVYNLLCSTLEENNLTWSDFENALGEISVNTLFDVNLFSSYDDDEYKSYEIMCQNARQLSKDIINQIPFISALFCEWIKETKLNVNVHQNIKPFNNILKLIKKDDLFLNFNYTTLLEDIYKIENVLHIHGVADYNSYIRNDLIVGHGKKESHNNEDEALNEFDYIIKETQEEVRMLLLKPISKTIERNKKFFNSLNNVDEIIVIGCGYSSVDYPYFEEIIKYTNNPFWTLTYYEGDGPYKANNFVKIFNLEYYKVVNSKELLY